MKKLARTAVLVVAVLALAGCASSPSGISSQETVAPPSTEAPLIVFAAASLQASFDDLAEQFTSENPQYPVAPIRYDGSQALATQIVDGADVDVIAFASEPSLEPVTDTGLAEDPRVFATNTLRIAVQPGNPKGIEDLSDLADVDVVLCAPEVPCGAASTTLLDDAGIALTPVSEETNVTSVVRRVSEGEADAGLVYATDIEDADGKLEGITPSNADKAVNRYPIVAATDAPSSEAAAAFVEFVLSDAGQQILEKYGFGRP